MILIPQLIARRVIADPRQPVVASIHRRHARRVGARPEAPITVLVIVEVLRPRSYPVDLSGRIKTVQRIVGEGLRPHFGVGGDRSRRDIPVIGGRPVAVGEIKLGIRD